jgi:hypothetical protein
MFVIPWKIHFLVSKKLGKVETPIIQHEKGTIVLTMKWKRWGGISCRSITLFFKDMVVEWNDRKDETLRYSYGYEKMGSYCGYPVIIIDENLQISRSVPVVDDYEVCSVELYSRAEFDRTLMNDLTKIPVFKGSSQI